MHCSVRAAERALRRGADAWWQADHWGRVCAPGGSVAWFPGVCVLEDLSVFLALCDRGEHFDQRIRAGCDWPEGGEQ